MPFRVLGIPLAMTKLNVTHYGLFVDEIVAYVNAWMGKLYHIQLELSLLDQSFKE